MSDPCDGRRPGRLSAWHDEAYRAGAAVAFGLMGMAEAIRTLPGVSDWTCRSCDTFNAAGALTCDDCGYDWS